MTAPEPAAPSGPTPTKADHVIGAIVLIILLAIATALMWFLFGLLFYVALKIPDGRTLGLAVAVVITIGLVLIRSRLAAKHKQRVAVEAAVADAAGDAARSGLPPVVHARMTRAISDAGIGTSTEKFVASRLAEATRWRTP